MRRARPAASRSSRGQRTDRERRARRRRPDGDAARAPVRKDGRALLDRLRRLPGGIRRPNSGRGERPALLGGGRFGDRPSVEPACADRAHEHASRSHDQDLVRRRRGPHADAREAPASGRSRRDRLSRGDARVLRAPRRRSPTPDATKPGATNISFSSIATSRAGSAAFSSTGSTARATPKIPRSTPTSPSCATSARASSPFIREIVRRERGDALERGRAGGAARPPRPLCRVQPALRPRHDFRLEDRRQCRLNSVVHAARGALALSAATLARSSS